MRPPPAAAFMDSYKRDDAVRSVSFSYYMGDLDNGWHDTHRESEYHISHSEWWGDGTIANYINSNYFTFGWGYQTLTPFLQTGFVSPYFGLTAWGNLFTIFNAGYIVNDEEDFLSHFSGGGMAIQQIPLNDKWKIGITEHLSRNGRELYYVDDALCEMFCIEFPKPRPKFYTEVGGGFYASRKFENSRMSLEFRYGRDLDEDRNRFTATVSFWGFSGVIGVGGNDQMRRMAAKDSIKRANTTFFIDSTTSSTTGGVKHQPVQSINYRWFRIKDTTKVTSYQYHPTKETSAIFSDGICYDSSKDAVLIRQREDSSIVVLPLTSVDYCQETQMKGFLGISLAEGALMFLPGGFMTGGLTGAFVTSVATAVGSYAALKIIDPKNPKVNRDICEQEHSGEEIREWFKQYPCSAKATNHF